MLYRAFPATPGAGPTDEGGALFVPRLDQGRGRHDNPDTYGALYLSRVPQSPIAEVLRDYVARGIAPRPLLREGSPLRLAVVDDAEIELVDLDDPRSLAARELRPSGVATHDREATQPLARGLYDEGAPGFEWWSTIEASWINVTLFEERVVGRLALVDEPEPLTIDHPAVQAAADAVGVFLR